MARKKTISSGLGLFTANKVQGLTENRASIVGVTAASVTGSIATNYTSSYRYDDPGNPLKSTQQLNIDWANFENHTFLILQKQKSTWHLSRLLTTILLMEP